MSFAGNEKASHPELPVIFLKANDLERDVLEGFGLGGGGLCDKTVPHEGFTLPGGGGVAPCGLREGIDDSPFPPHGAVHGLPLHFTQTEW